MQHELTSYTTGFMLTFWNKNFTRDVLITLVTSAVVVVSCFYGPTVHMPFLVGMLTAVGLGWILAIEQIVLIAIFYFVIDALKLLPAFDVDATQFSALLQFFPAFTGSFLGGFIRRSF